MCLGLSLRAKKRISKHITVIGIMTISLSLNNKTSIRQEILKHLLIEDIGVNPIERTILFKYSSNYYTKKLNNFPSH